jgi:hypothetical protein
VKGKEDTLLKKNFPENVIFTKLKKLFQILTSTDRLLLVIKEQNKCCKTRKDQIYMKECLKEYKNNLYIRKAAKNNFLME